MRENLIGKRFGKLTVIGFGEKREGSRKTYFDCICDCGNLKTVRTDQLKGGLTKSCGCLKKEQDTLNLNRTTHNKSKTRIYKIWQSMKKRCYSEKDKCFYRYGGRGISVCDDWKESFERFYEWSIENGYSDSLTIDRIDNDGNYEPSNCRWTTLKEQSNNRSTNIKIKIGNATKTLTEWCEIFELDYKKINARYNRNEDISLFDLFN